MEEVIEMTQKELFRHHIFKKLVEKELTQKKAAEILNISDRQVRNLLKSFNTNDVKGLISKKRGKASNRQRGVPLKKNGSSFNKRAL